MKTIVVDYGLGNVFSVCRAFEHCGSTVELSSDPDKISRADFLVLPGVGAFPNGISNLKEKNLIPPIRAFLETKRPFMGICLGMQLMLTKGEEFEDSEGINIIGGSVVPIPNTGTNGQGMRVPHIGWSSLNSSNPKVEDTILSHVIGQDVYFVHSFEAKTASEENLLATVDYGGNPITAAVFKDNVYGLQFHPERSGLVGLSIINSFLKS